MTHQAQSAGSWVFASAVEPRSVDVEGAQIRYRLWSGPARQSSSLLFIAGFRAHSHWWDHIVPFFADTHRVGTMDLSGLGDSDARAHYTIRQWGREVLAVTKHAGLEPVTVVAHSFAGHATAMAARLDPQALRRLIFLDTRFYLADFIDRLTHSYELKLGKRVYATRQEALDHFHLIPSARGTPRSVYDHVAAHSITEIEGGWTWKHDGALNPSSPHDPDRFLADGIETPTDLVLGALSDVVSRQLAARIAQRFRWCGLPIEVPGVGHHMMLESPEITVAVLRALLANPRAAPTAGAP